MPSNFTSQDLSFSPVSEDDFEDLLSLRIAAMKESLSRIGRFDPLRARERFRSGFSPENTRHVVVSGSRVGFVTVKPCDDGLLLDHLYVLPSFQGRGIGALILASIFNAADTDGQQIRVGALKESDSNRFYERHGFKMVSEGEWDNYFVRPCQTPA
jgi:GNAT superfamily N-acetyltransferase